LNSEMLGVLFLFTICIVVGGSSLLVISAFLSSIQGDFSPKTILTTTLVITLVSIAFLQMFGFSHVRINACVAVVLTAAALLVLPIRRQRLDFPPLTTLRRIIIATSACLGTLFAFGADTAWQILRFVGISDDFKHTTAGVVTQYFFYICIGCCCGVTTVLCMRIRDELACSHDKEEICD